MGICAPAVRSRKRLRERIHLLLVRGRSPGSAADSGGVQLAKRHSRKRYVLVNRQYVRSAVHKVFFSKLKTSD